MQGKRLHALAPQMHSGLGGWVPKGRFKLKPFESFRTQRILEPYKPKPCTVRPKPQPETRNPLVPHRGHPANP